MPDDFGDNLFRLVLDESSFNFRDLNDGQVEMGLNELNEQLALLRQARHSVAKSSLIYDIDCRYGLDIHSFLFRNDTSEVSRDARQRTYLTFDRLPTWDDGDCPDVPLECRIDGRGPGPAISPSVGYALVARLQDRGVACLTFPSFHSKGFHRVAANCGDGEVYFFMVQDDLKDFWRSIFSVEDVPEGKFYETAIAAFPDLVLHSSLTFSHFDGKYLDLRQDVVEILSALNDHFTRVLHECKGIPYDIQSAMGHYRIDLSPESPKTRASARLMAKRDVDHEGTTYRCEWHAKLEPHRNRIHFTLPSPNLGGRVLIGLFVDHLPT